MVEWITVKFPKLKDVKDNFKLIGNNATSKAEFYFLDEKRKVISFIKKFVNKLSIDDEK